MSMFNHKSFRTIPNGHVNKFTCKLSKALRDKMTRIKSKMNATEGIKTLAFKC